MEIVELNSILSKCKSNERISIICSHCSTVVSKSYKYLKQSIRKSKDGLTVRLFCCSQCHYDYYSSEFNQSVNCDYCGKSFVKSKTQISKTSANYCSRSCAARVNNKSRIRTEESRKKVSDSLKKLYGTDSPETLKECRNCGEGLKSTSAHKYYCSRECAAAKQAKPSEAVKGRKAGPLKCKIEFGNCRECGALFMSYRDGNRTKHCSKECTSKNASKRQSARLSLAENRANLGRHRMSYMESSFKAWLEDMMIDFRFEPQFKNHELGKYYYPDFVFDDIMLIIELDGNQHEKTREKDAIRDEYLSRYYGYSVVRIKHKEYIKKTRFEEICTLLGICVLESVC